MPRSVLRPPAARVVASRAMDALCRLLEGGSAALKALSHHPYRPRGRYRGVYKLYGAHRKR